MNEIKVGEYARLARCQGINKIIDINKDGDLILEEYIADEYAEETQIIRLEDIETEIKKHSFNIIDLIEAEDYINGNRVYKVTSNCIYCIGKAIQNKSNINIKTILTHEQYERNSYRLENN